MRILYFSDNTSDHNRRFLEKLAGFGHEVWFLDSSSDHVPEAWLPTGVRGLAHRKVVPRDSDPGVYEEFLPEFQSLLAESQPQLIHAGPIQGCAYLGACSGFHPLLVSSWGSDLLLDAHRDAEWKRATLMALGHADGFMCDCDTVRIAAQGFAPIPDSRIVQFPWGVKRGMFSVEGPLPAGDGLPLEVETIPIICTRSWEPRYGIEVLLKAFKQAHARNRMLRLMLLGGGSMAETVHDFIFRNGLQEVVLTPGRIAADDLPGWFRAASGYVSCARSDGTSISLLEAMATGLPVLVTDIPSNREWVCPEENGWLAEAGRPEDFASKMLKMAGLKPSQRQAIRERNQRIVAERADWDKNFPLLLDLYELLVKVSAVTSA
ncbi:MAG: glycosyltransferase family 4 protein [Terriglobales bacterium]